MAFEQIASGLLCQAGDHETAAVLQRVHDEDLNPGHWPVPGDESLTYSAIQMIQF